MANTTNIAGKLIGVKIGDDYYRCQSDAKLSLGSSVTADAICKPDPAGSIVVPWETSTVDSKNWKITFSAQAFLDSVAGVKDNNDLITLFISGDLQITADFLSSVDLTGDESYDNDFLFTGPGILASIDVNAPSKGAATYDVSITGNGQPTYSLIPKTT